jgi:glycosyltransferase involved in cell wall biosynthesis
MAISVLHICDKFGVAGSSTHGVSRLFSWWIPRYDPRFEVGLCGLKSPEPGSQALEAQGIPVTHFGRGPFDPRLLSDIVRHARRRRARILHVHGYAASDFGRLAAKLTGAVLILHEHFADPRIPPHQAMADLALARLTDAAIAVSASTAEFLRGPRHVPASRVRIIYNGAPLDEFGRDRPAERERLRAELRLPSDAKVVGTIGRLNAQKGHRHLLDAAERVIAQDPAVRFLIVGDGDLMDGLREQAARRGIRDKVVFTGHREDVPTILQAIDILCISSLYEGTPRVLFEGMAAGRPVISTSVDGCREVLEEGVTGLMVSPGDAASLADRLLRVVRNADLSESLGRRAREVSTRYDIAQSVREMEALYDELLGAR